MSESKSIFSPGESGMTRGGLDRYLGPQAEDFSSLPGDIDNPHAADQVAEVDCGGAGKDEAVCQIAEAERVKSQADKGAKSRPD